MTTTTKTSEARFAEQVQSAPFIFVGRIVQPGASTVREIAPQPGLAVVLVEDVYRAPVSLGALKGTRLTIMLDRKRPTEKGTRTLFYATSWMYSDGIAVVEVARASVPADAKVMLERVVRAELLGEDEKLADRLRRADLVVTGLVESVSPIEAQRTSLTSEHDPVWWRSDLLIDRANKGQLKEPRLAIAFPASLDEYWIDVPKLQAGQRGLFILHRQSDSKRARLRPPLPAVLDPLDVQPMTQAERVRALLKLAAREV